MQRLLRILDATSFELTGLAYWLGGAAAGLFALSFFLPPLEYLALGVILFAAGMVLWEVLLLYGKGRSIGAERVMAERFSNGRPNTVRLRITSTYSFPVRLSVLDELPPPFLADMKVRRADLPPRSSLQLTYMLTPSERGVSRFGHLLVWARAGIGLIRRRYALDHERTVKVYPASPFLRRSRIGGRPDERAEAGEQALLKSGGSTEFDQIQEYVPGRDFRSVNWKATARRGGLMVNTYTDERSQPLYCLLDTGRLMGTPIGGLTLLDHSVNAALKLMQTALHRGDRAGLLTFGSETAWVPAGRGPAQLRRLMESLYRLQTDFGEGDAEELFSEVRSRIKPRSLLVIFTQLQSEGALERNLPSLRLLARHHQVLLVFFDHPGILELAQKGAEDLRGIYTQTIARAFVADNRRIVHRLRAAGIATLLTRPEKLTAEVVGNYVNRQS